MSCYTSPIPAVKPEMIEKLLCYSNECRQQLIITNSTWNEREKYTKVPILVTPISVQSMKTWSPAHFQIGFRIKCLVKSLVLNYGLFLISFIQIRSN